ncbi:hypothetical protein CONCODRAFT_78849 [Conidiobolus coronatus NRRL 28638]|uniref:C2H2-type domain-containing protein n=1 Tax=Conidiobolus coronatus (strain ATCC 28846 / CBS 209.66 / NRRL 28638) TaxID=796925 RepID=A0A137P677_CONC2|nr:hypothetical protein CONCODRAFT_78849 [Conidiobolus coronatus NRRL 28638]|eukprot:KXN70434.1 hypothetical protein CONCODRAFT_78849 [Conidiobolus coronatus NRRL 28638]
MPQLTRTKTVDLPSIYELGLEPYLESSKEHHPWMDWYSNYSPADNTPSLILPSQLNQAHNSMMGLSLPSDNFNFNSANSDGDTVSSISASSEGYTAESSERVELKPIKTKRVRRKHHEVERIYNCIHPGCQKAYSVLNHLNTHIKIQNHGRPRINEEFPRKK